MNESMGRRIFVAAVGSVIAGITIALFAPSVPGVRAWIGREAPAAWNRATSTFNGEVGTTIVATIVAIGCIIIAGYKAREQWSDWNHLRRHRDPRQDTFRGALILTAFAVGVAVFLGWVYLV